MKRSLLFAAGVLSLALQMLSLPADAGPYDTPALLGALWLERTQDASDGSWGATDGLKPLQTAEAVMALRALNRRNSSYYSGLTWLENHETPNADFRSRRAQALALAGRSVGPDLSRLIGGQDSGALGVGGWGLSILYRSAPIDTGLTLQALNAAGSTSTAAAVSFLKSTRLTGTSKGWPVGQGTTTDVTATASAVRSLIPFKAADPLVATAVTEALGTLTTQVGTASPDHLKAIAALAMLRNDPAAPAATALLDALVLSQATDGSWGGDPYTTALAAQAMAARIGSDAPTNLQSVLFADPNLRTAVNTTLGRNSLDALNRGELAQLTSLNASNMGITSLQGLEYAVNLRTIDLRGNPITTPRAATTVALTASSYYSMVGRPVTLTAQVAAPLAIGKVDFYDRGQLLGTADASAGRAALSITPAVGQNQFTVQYSGDVANAPSTSAALAHLTDSGAVLHSILQLLLE